MKHHLYIFCIIKNTSLSLEMLNLISMKNILVVLFILLCSYQGYSQTLKIAHKSHSGNMNSFVVTKNLHNLGLSSSEMQKRQAEKERKRDSLEKIYLAKKKQDSLEKIEKKNPKNPKKELKKEEIKSKKTSQNEQKEFQKAELASQQTASLAYPVAHQTAHEDSSKNWLVMLMTVLPTFLVLYFVLQKIKWM